MRTRQSIIQAVFTRTLEIPEDTKANLPRINQHGILFFLHQEGQKVIVQQQVTVQQKHSMWIFGFQTNFCQLLALERVHNSQILGHNT